MRTLYQDSALFSVRSQNDLKVPRKLFNVTNISISTENWISTSVYWNLQIVRGNYTIVETHTYMNMARNVYEYGRIGKYVYILRYTYAGIGEKSLQTEEEDRYKSRVMRTSIDTDT